MTGPRTIDPRLAAPDNPWDLPGHLLVGHSIFRWNPEVKQYTAVQIKALHSEVREDIHEVWDIHLRGSQRSYHANGFLVAVNYPEVSRSDAVSPKSCLCRCQITVKSIASTLDSLNTDDQMKCLLAFPELHLLFQRFDQATVSAALR